MLRTFNAHGVRYQLETFGHPHLDKMTRGNIPFERPLLEHVYSLKLSGTVIDVGAHVGNHSLWFHLVCGLRVKAFEPIWMTELRKNIDRNGADDVTIHPVALGAEPGAAQQTGNINVEYGDGDITVHTLDSYGFHDVSLIKVDVEGLEDQVLRGAVETIRRERPIIVAEQWDDDANAKIRAVLEPLGYTMTKLWTLPDLQTPMGQWQPAMVNAMPEPIVLRAQSKKQLRLAFREVQRTHGDGVEVAFANARSPHVQQALRGLAETGSITEPVYTSGGYAVVKTVVKNVEQPTFFDPPAEPISQQNVAGEELVVNQHEDEVPSPPSADLSDVKAPPTSGPGSSVEAWRAYASAVTGTDIAVWAQLDRTQIIEELRRRSV